MNTFRLRILEADGVFYDGECESLIFPDTDGLYGVQAHHTNMVTAVVSGIAVYTLPGGVKKHAAVSDGILKVENNDVLMLVNTAERPEDVDANKARREAEEAKDVLLQKRSNLAYKAAKEKIIRELNRIKLSEYES